MALPPSAIPDLGKLDAVIATPRLVLRPLEPRHADELFPYASDPEVARTMSWTPHADVDVTRTWVAARASARANQTGLVWAIEQAGAAIGCASLIDIQWTYRAWRIDRAELGYWLGKPFWGQGLMTEVAHATTSWSFETLGLHKLTIGCIDGNLASQRIIERLGYRFLAILEDDFWRDGQWWNHRRYELTSAEWRALKSGEPVPTDDMANTLRFSKPRPP